MEASYALKPARNCSIDIMRLVAAIGALAAHTYFLIDFNETFYYIFVNIIMGRFVVQFFACITGFYFCKELLSGKPAFKKSFPKMLKIYFIWSVIYYIASFVENVVMGDTPLDRFLIERVLFFFTEGSYSHFWNFPAILYSMIIINFVYKFFSEKGLFILSCFSILLFLIGAFGTPYYTISQNIPILSDFYAWDGFHVFRSIFLIGLPFVSLGYLLNRIGKIYEKWSNSKTLILLAISFMLYCIESIIMILFLDGIERPFSQFTTYPFVLCLFVALLRFPMLKFATFSDWSRKLANFIYFIHSLLIAISAMAVKILNIEISGTFLFFIVLITSSLMGYILVKINTNWSLTLLGLPTKSKTPKKEVVK